MKNLIIFGIGEIAELAHYYFTNDSDYSVEAFCIDKDFKSCETFCDLEVFEFEDLEKTFETNKYHVFIALSYTEMNDLRARKVNEAQNKGFQIASYISSKATTFNDFFCGLNCFILEDNTIQPYVKIGNNVTLWSGNHIGHHSKIKDNSFISSHVVVSGGVTVGKNSFLGVNSTINDQITLGEYTLVASGALINKNTNDYSICIGSPFKEKEDMLSTEIKL